MSNRIRVLVADGHPIYRSALEALLGLEPDLEVVGRAGTGEEAVERVRALRPDVVVMALEIPGMGGLEAIRQVAALGTGTRVLVLTPHGENEFLLPVLEAGAHGVVREATADEDVAPAVRMLAGGGVFLYPAGTRLLLRSFREAASRARAHPVEGLSAREAEVLELTARGYNSAEAGRKLSLSPKTVDTYRARMMHKLGLTSRADVVSFALGAGVLAAPP